MKKVLCLENLYNDHVFIGLFYSSGDGSRCIVLILNCSGNFHVAMPTSQSPDERIRSWSRSVISAIAHASAHVYTHASSLCWQRVRSPYWCRGELTLIGLPITLTRIHLKCLRKMGHWNNDHYKRRAGRYSETDFSMPMFDPLFMAI